MSYTPVTANADVVYMQTRVTVGIYTADSGVAYLHKRRCSIATLRKRRAEKVPKVSVVVFRIASAFVLRTLAKCLQ